MLRVGVESDGHQTRELVETKQLTRCEDLRPRLDRGLIFGEVQEGQG